MAEKILWKELAYKAKKAAANQFRPGQRMEYLYGAKGEFITTRAQVEYYFRAEPTYFTRYNVREREEIINHILYGNCEGVGPITGAYCYDCSGFVGWFLTGDKTYSAGQYGHRTLEAPSLKAGVGGSLLFTTYGGSGRHIGVDVRNGEVCDMAYESTAANVKAGKSGVRLYRLDDGTCAWEHSFQSPFVDYTGADAT